MAETLSLKDFKRQEYPIIAVATDKSWTTCKLTGVEKKLRNYY